MDLGDAMGIGRRLGLGQERRALAVGGQHGLERRRLAARGLLRHDADLEARIEAQLALSGCSSPAMSRNSVDLPDPLRPTSAIRVLSGTSSEAPSSRARPAMRRVTSWSCSMGPGFWVDEQDR